MSDSSEEEYLADLKQQRHMYAWCLRNVGTFSNEQSQKESEEFCCYQPPEEEYREFVFHDDVWHWATLKIKG